MKKFKSLITPFAIPISRFKMKKLELIGISAISLFIVAVIFDIIGITHKFGAIEGVLITPIPFEIVGVGLVGYILSKLPKKILIFVGIIMIALESIYLLLADVSKLSPLGLGICLFFLASISISLIIGFKMGGNAPSPHNHQFSSRVVSEREESEKAPRQDPSAER